LGIDHAMQVPGCVLEQHPAPVCNAAIDWAAVAPTAVNGDPGWPSTLSDHTRVKAGARRLEAEAARIQTYRQLWDARFHELDKVVEELKRKEKE
jgi:hypothetical protein